MALARRICSERFVRFFAPDLARGVSEFATAAKYWMTFLVFSVFPAPDSPLDCVRRTCFVFWNGDLRDKDTLVGAFVH